MNKYNCEPEMFEAVERPEMPLNESFFKNKRMYEARHFDSLARLVERYRGIRPTGNYLHFAQNWGDVDVNYASYINE